MTAEKIAPWFRVWTAVWRRHVDGLSLAEQGLAIGLLVVLHEAGEPIPDDRARLARRFRTSRPRLDAMLASVTATGLVDVKNGAIWSSYIANDIELRREKSLTLKKNADSRWKKSEQNQWKADAIADREERGKRREERGTDPKEDRSPSPPSSPTINEGHRSTFEGSRDAPYSAPLPSRTVYRVGDEVTVPHRGQCFVTDDSSVNCVTVKEVETGDEFDVEFDPSGKAREVEDTSWMNETYEGGEDAA